MYGYVPKMGKLPRDQFPFNMINAIKKSAESTPVIFGRMKDLIAQKSKLILDRYDQLDWKKRASLAAISVGVAILGGVTGNVPVAVAGMSMSTTMVGVEYTNIFRHFQLKSR